MFVGLGDVDKKLHVRCLAGLLERTDCWEIQPQAAVALKSQTIRHEVMGRSLNLNR